MDITLVLIASYILGAIPFGFVIVKAWKGIDIRKYGSGNIGATNVLRVAGKSAAIIVFLADILKGFTPVFVTSKMYPDLPWLILGSGLLAIVGHSASVFLKFQGGKGAATSLGVIIGLNPIVAGITFGIFLLTVGITRYVSVASVVATIGVPILMFIFGEPIFAYFTLIPAVGIIIKHRSNFVRLMQGKEPRIGEKVKVMEGSDG